MIAAKNIHARYFLTSKDDEIDEIQGLRMGADDYVKKPFSQRLLIERVRSLLRRQVALDGVEIEETDETKVMIRGQLTMDPLRHSVSWKGNNMTLTVTAFMLLQALAISKQIVEAHNGVIWAENIRPTHAAPDSPPLGARFVVGLPV